MNRLKCNSQLLASNKQKLIGNWSLESNLQLSNDSQSTLLYSYSPLLSHSRTMSADLCSIDWTMRFSILSLNTFPITWRTAERSWGSWVRTRSRVRRARSDGESSCCRSRRKLVSFQTNCLPFLRSWVWKERELIVISPTWMYRWIQLWNFDQIELGGWLYWN